MDAIIFLLLYLYLRKGEADPWYFYGLFCAIGLWYGPSFWAILDRVWTKVNRKLDEWADV